MLLEFLCSNHKSFRREILFSALAGKDTTNENLLTEFNDIRVLKSAIIYGANGSGKSNFIDALSFVKQLVLNSINHQPGQGIRQSPHKLEPISSDSRYRIQFVTKGIRFVFGFTLCNSLVKEEYLYYFPNGRQTKIFERKAEIFVTGSKFRGKLATCKDVLKPNRLLLSCAANFSAVPEIEQVYTFFRDELIIYTTAEPNDSWMQYSLHQMQTNRPMKQAVLKTMQGLGIAVKDINVKIEQKALPFDESILPDFLSDDFKREILQNAVSIQAKVIYDTFSTDLLQEESNGIKKLFGFLCPFLDIMVKGKTLICDELEGCLHESLVHELLNIFMNPSVNTNAQLVFTTHDTSLLDTALFRRDQIWFTEMSAEDRSSELYSLAEIKNIRKEERYGKRYISGRYGAIPMLNLNFADIVSTIE